MLYPVYVHVGNEQQAHGVVFPDFPGCFSAADDWASLPGAIQEAVEAHFHGEPDAVPAPTPLDQLVNSPDYQGGIWLLADIDLSRIETKPVRLNISLPSNLVQQIDAWANARHMTRSGFLAKAAQQAMQA
ncbi:MAG: type II toxin-antitoxin system HicB family antitoxin [Giesbergeria sp.]|uniref:type II toxin-antitoxin system HicB family antitoxin n=1 Tax=Giesbergeria sp. TaxID=2818473 RepID=UPI002607269A|nr:type II toxin-antitoxin system HicB family antitoxin [Giesbergeria sp.]MDD2608211.1 type II toxin-antitoxin system HicB family antitoxin [Giesbergeria sp.]